MRGPHGCPDAGWAWEEANRVTGVHDNCRIHSLPIPAPSLHPGASLALGESGPPAGSVTWSNRVHNGCSVNRHRMKGCCKVLGVKRAVALKSDQRASDSNSAILTKSGGSSHRTAVRLQQESTGSRCFSWPLPHTLETVPPPAPTASLCGLGPLPRAL